MSRKLSLVLRGGVTALLLLAPASATAQKTATASAGTTVTVRVEGRARTLLPATAVRTHGGSITMGGAKAGACPATSAAGALDVATRHRWSGQTFSSTPGIFVTSILGESYSTKASYYWEVFVDNVAAPSGVCETALHRGEQLLFAAVPVKGTTYPLALSAPAHASAGHAFRVTVVYVNAGGRRVPLGGARITGSGMSATTNRQGTASVTATRSGTLVLGAGKGGYVRAATVRMQIS